MLHGQKPDNFASLTFEIKSGLAIPFVRKDQRHHVYNKPTSPQVYPIHKKGTDTYNLLTALDSLEIKQHIEIKGEYNYAFAVRTAQTYASKLRNDRPPVQMYLRTEWNKSEQIGRIWRLG